MRILSIFRRMDWETLSFLWCSRSRSFASATTSWWKRGRRRLSEWRTTPDAKPRTAEHGSTMKGNSLKSASSESSRSASRGNRDWPTPWPYTARCGTTCVLLQFFCSLEVQNITVSSLFCFAVLLLHSKVLIGLHWQESRVSIIQYYTGQGCN